MKENNSHPKKARILLKVAVGFILLIGTIGLVTQLLDVSALVHAFAELPRETWLIILALGAASWCLRGLRTWILFPEIGLIDALGMSFIHNTANNLAPMRLGELALPALAKWLGNIGFSTGFTSLLWIRFLDLISLLGIGVCVLGLSRGGTAMLALLAVLIFLTPLLLRWTLPLLQTVPCPRVLHPIRAQLMYEATQGHRLHRLWRLTILSWLCKLMGMAVLLASLSGLDLSQVMAIILGAELSSILPIHGLAGAGSYQAGGVLGSVLMGQTALIGLQLSVQLHLYVLSLTCVFGILGALLLAKRTVHG